jgi:hypothetical protein
MCRCSEDLSLVRGGVLALDHSIFATDFDLLAQKPFRVNPAKYLIPSFRLRGNLLAQNQMFLGSGLC